MYGQNNGYFMNGYNQQGYNPYMMNNGAMPDMLNQAKIQYAQQMPQQTMQTQPTQMQNLIQKPSNDMLWVLNESEATAYPVAPNNSVVLWDKSKPTIYVKSVNAQGVPSIRILDFEERTEATETPDKHVCKCGDKFATKEQLSAVESKINDILAMYEELKDKQTVKTTKLTKKEVE